VSVFVPIFAIPKEPAKGVVFVRSPAVVSNPNDPPGARLPDPMIEVTTESATELVTASVPPSATAMRPALANPGNAAVEVIVRMPSLTGVVPA
jgi:hypothetical protein